MYAISLTSIPPRLARLGPVLDSLLAQDPPPAGVFLCLPRRYRRFHGPAVPPALPRGVTLLRPPDDNGPASKVLPAARMLAGREMALLYCDDDWLMPPGWAARLLRGWRGTDAVAGAGFGVERLKRQPQRAFSAARVDIAQGYAGVLVRPEWLADDHCAPPPAAWPADDIWLSGQLARQGIAVRLQRDARAGMRLAIVDHHALQDAVIDGRTRHAADLAGAEELTARYGLWPPLR